MSHKKGALPSQMLKQLIAARHIVHADERQVQPASVDLTTANEIYRLPGVIQPRAGETMQKLLRRINYRRHNIDQTLECGVPYLVRLRERVELPDRIYGYANPKSTTGRWGIHARLIADFPRFDTLPTGYSGDLWVLVVSHAFPILLCEGDALVQLRLFNADTRLSQDEIDMRLRSDQLLWSMDGKAYGPKDIKIGDNDGSLILTLDVSSHNIGWECMGSSSALKFSAESGAYRKEDFFRPVYAVGDFVELKKNRFYILSSSQSVRVPPNLACEMRPMDDRAGEFRAHYAGYIDPGWGYGSRGNTQGRPLTLEVRPHEDILVGEGQAIAKIRFELMADTPDMLYDTAQPTYAAQSGAMLAKQFA